MTRHNELDVSQVRREQVLPMRERYRQEMHCQIILDSWLGRGWVDAYELRSSGHVVGYGLVGGVRADPKETITEFYVLPTHRGDAVPLFQQFASTCHARNIEVQTNDVLLTLMLYDCACDIQSDTVLFHDALTTSLVSADSVVRPVTPADQEQIQHKELDSDAEWLIEHAGQVVGTGGILTHYNPPYGDIFMQITDACRRRGLGSFLVQELKRLCRERGQIPAARCHAANSASRATLQRAGLWPCGRVLTGQLRRSSY